MRNAKIEEVLIKDILKPGYYSIICQIRKIKDIEKKQATLIVTDGTINLFTGNEVTSCVQISLKNVDNKFRDLYLGQIINLSYVAVSSVHGIFYFNVNCPECPLKDISLLRMEKIKLKIHSRTCNYEIPKHYSKCIKGLAHVPFFLSLDPCDENCEFTHYVPSTSWLSKQELKTDRTLSVQPSLTNSIHSTYTKLNEIEGQKIVINVYGYVVKIKRRQKIHPKHIVSTLHIVDDTLQFGQVVVIRILTTDGDKAVPPKTKSVLRIHDLVASKTVKESVVSLRGDVCSADRIVFFSVNNRGFLDYETSAQLITITDDDENSVRNIWNTMKGQEMKLSYIHLPGFYAFKCEVCTVRFNSEKSVLEIRGETLLSSKINVEIINMTPSFNRLKKGDIVKFNRVMAISNSQTGRLIFKIDCEACEVQRI